MSVARKEATAQIVEEYQLFDGDTGSCSVQIALLSQRIRHLTEHLKKHRKDFHTTHGLKKLVSQRRKLMKYFKAKNAKAYQELIQKLQLRDIKAL